MNQANHKIHKAPGGLRRAARPAFCAALLAGLALPASACLETRASPFDTSQGGLLGAAVTLIAAPPLATPEAAAAPTGRFFAFTDAAQYYESTGGGTWTATSYTASANIEFAAAGAGGKLWGVTSDTSDNLRVSEDGGLTWTNPTSAPTLRFRAVAACGTQIVATYEQGTSNFNAYYSLDDGATWNISTIDGSGFGVVATDMQCINGSRFLVSYDNGSADTAAYSDDGGASWSFTGVGFFGAFDGRFAYSADLDRLLLVGNPSGDEIRLSTDRGASFGASTSLAIDFSALGAFSGAVARDNSNFYVGLVALAPTRCRIWSNADGVNASWSFAESLTCPGTNPNLTYGASGTPSGGGGQETIFTGADTTNSEPLLLRKASGGSWTIDTLPPVAGATNIVHLIFAPDL